MEMVNSRSNPTSNGHSCALSLVPTREGPDAPEIDFTGTKSMVAVMREVEGRRHERVRVNIGACVELGQSSAISGRILDASPAGIFFACDGGYVDGELTDCGAEHIEPGSFIPVRIDGIEIPVLVRVCWVGYSATHGVEGFGGYFATGERKLFAL